MSDTGKPLKFPSRPRAGAVSSPPGSAAGAWVVLIIDDEEEVHKVTRLALKGLELFGKPVELASAYSAAEAKAQLSAGLRPAVILLDVVMEDDDAGLRLAAWIRGEHGDKASRIILRTGQPGHAPERSVIFAYEINDYKEKTELTSEKLLSSVVTAIRGYRDLRTIEQGRAGMSMVLDAAPTLFRLQSMKLFASGVLTQLIALMHKRSDAACLGVSGFSAAVVDGGFVILAGTGRYATLVDSRLDGALAPGLDGLVRRAAEVRGPVCEDGRLLVSVEDDKGRKSVLCVEDCPDLDSVDMGLVSLYCVNVAAAFTNMSLYTRLQEELETETALVREVHHRVKNNLQIIRSLMSLARDEGEGSAEEILEATERRIAEMAIVHERIYTTGQDEFVDMEDCLGAVVDLASAGLAVDFRGEAVTLPLSKAVPVALLCGELLNLGRKVVRGTADRLAVSATLSPGNDLSVRLEGDIDGGRLGSETFSLVLIGALAAQLEGSVDWSAGPPACVVATFPVD